MILTERRPLYFHGHPDGLDFYYRVEEFSIQFYMFLPETLITCPVEEKQHEGLKFLHCLWFTPVLPPDVCLSSV